MAYIFYNFGHQFFLYSQHCTNLIAEVWEQEKIFPEQVQQTQADRQTDYAQPINNDNYYFTYSNRLLNCPCTITVLCDFRNNLGEHNVMIYDQTDGPATKIKLKLL